MPKLVREVEPSRLVSVPVNLVSFLVLAFLCIHYQSDVAFWLTHPLYPQPFFSPVITGKVTSLVPRPRGTLQITVSLIKAYKAGQLTITQVGETMSVKLLSQCKKCPLLRKGELFVVVFIFITMQALQISILVNSINITLFNLLGDFFSLSDRCQLHHHGSGEWRRTRCSGTRCIHSTIQSRTPQFVNEYQQPTLLTSQICPDQKMETYIQTL